MTKPDSRLSFRTEIATIKAVDGGGRRWARGVSRQSMTVEDLVTRHGPHLLASQLKSECQRYRELVVRAAEDRRALVARLTEDQRIGEAVRDAARAGRKTVRIADLSPELAAQARR